jgi:hypothetical protein
MFLQKSQWSEDTSFLLSFPPHHVLYEYFFLFCFAKNQNCFSLQLTDEIWSSNFILGFFLHKNRNRFSLIVLNATVYTSALNWPSFQQVVYLLSCITTNKPHPVMFWIIIWPKTKHKSFPNGTKHFT